MFVFFLIFTNPFINFNYQLTLKNIPLSFVLLFPDPQFSLAGYLSFSRSPFLCALPPAFNCSFFLFMLQVHQYFSPLTSSLGLITSQDQCFLLSSSLPSFTISFSPSILSFTHTHPSVFSVVSCSYNHSTFPQRCHLHSLCPPTPFLSPLGKSFELLRHRLFSNTSSKSAPHLTKSFQAQDHAKIQAKGFTEI